MIMRKLEKRQKEKTEENEKNGKQEFSEVPCPQEENTGKLTVERIRSFPCYAHLTTEEAEAFAAYLALYCKAVFRYVESQQAQDASRGTSFDLEQYNKAA